MHGWQGGTRARLPCKPRPARSWVAPGLFLQAVGALHHGGAARLGEGSFCLQCQAISVPFRLRFI